MSQKVEENGLRVQFGNKEVAVRDLTTELTKYCAPVLIYLGNHTNYEIGRAGSSLRFQQDGCLYQMFTGHQLHNLGVKAKDVFIHRPEISDLKALGPCERISIKESAGIDWVMLRYESPVESKLLADRFMDIDLRRVPTLSTAVGGENSLLFGTGYAEQNARYDEGEIGLRMVSAATNLPLRVAKDRIGLDRKDRIVVELAEEFTLPKGFDFNGFSGTPIFFQQPQRDGLAIIGFAGIISEVVMDKRLQMIPGDLVVSILKEIDSPTKRLASLSL